MHLCKSCHEPRLWKHPSQRRLFLGLLEVWQAAYSVFHAELSMWLLYYNTYSPTQSKVSFKRFPYSTLAWGHSKTKTCFLFFGPFGGVHNTNPQKIHLAKQSCAQGQRPFFLPALTSGRICVNIIQNAHERVASLS